MRRDDPLVRCLSWIDLTGAQRIVPIDRVIRGRLEKIAVHLLNFHRNVNRSPPVHKCNGALHLLTIHWAQTECHLRSDLMILR